LGFGRGPLEADAAVAQCRQRPIPVVSAALSEGAVERAVRAGAGIVGDSLSTVDRMVSLLNRYDQVGGPGPRILIRRVWIGDHPGGQAAEQLAEYRAAAPPGRRSNWGDEDQSIVGATASEVVDQLGAVLARVGPVALNLRVHATGIPAGAVEDQIRQLGAEVLPRLRS
jgi:hypothetical protein